MTTLSFFSATGGELTLVSQALSRLRTRGLDITLFGRTKDQITDPELARAFAQAAARSDAIVLSFHGGTTSPTAMRRSGNQWRSHPMAASTPVLKLSEIWLPGREPSIASTGKACDGVSRKIATPCADPATAAPWPDDAPAIAHPE